MFDMKVCVETIGRDIDAMAQPRAVRTRVTHGEELREI
jgi:hypothetical protein